MPSEFPDEAETAARRFGRGPLLGLLTAIYGLNYLDRQLVGLFAEPIKRELQISDSGLGLLAGVAFAIFYASLGVPMARVAERVGRRQVLSASVFVFALATTLSAAVGSFWQLFAARLIVGVGEAGTTPSSLAIIADQYPPDRRAGAMAVFTAGALVGLLAGFVLTSQVAGRFGWRAGFLVAGLPGLALAVAAWRLLPPESLRDAAPRRPVGPVLLGLMRNRRFLWLALSGAMCLFTTSAIASWMPAYFQRAHGAGLPLTGLTFGAGIGVLGAIVTVLSGRLADRLEEGRRGRSLLMVVGAQILAILFFILALNAVSAGAFIALVLPGLGLGAVWQAPVLGQVQNLAQPSERPTVTAAFMLITSLLGLALGPLAVGLLSDHFGHGSAEGLRTALAISLFANVLAAGFLVAARGHPDVPGAEPPGVGPRAKPILGETS